LTDLSPAAQAVLCAYRDLSWTPDEEDNGKYYKFCHKAGMAAALRVVADQVVPPEQERLFNEERPWDGELCAVVEIRQQLIAIADELEGQ
jgi:hypothetical protein